jgi:alpha-beta hydrolase superfamily lysophospholipase
MATFKQRIHIGTEQLSVNIKEGHIGDILFLHGLGCSKESFDDVFKNNFFAGLRLIAPDLLGFGESSKPVDYSYTMNEHANTLKKLLFILKSERPVIVAHSMGGAIGLLLNDKLPTIKYFFCLEGNLISEDCFVSKKIASESENDFVKSNYYKNPLKYRCRQLESDPEPSPVAYYRSSVSLVEMSESGTLLNKYFGLKRPKTYIYGEENRNIKAVRTLAGTDVAEIKDCGHFMLNENPGQTYLEIEHRLAEKLSPLQLQ